MLKKNFLKKISVFCTLFMLSIFATNFSKPIKILANTMLNEFTNEELFEESIVFDSNKDGYGSTRIPGIVVTSKGTLLAYCEARSNYSDWATMDIILKRSEDGGETWSEPTILANGIETSSTYNNPVMITDEETGTVHMVYCKGYATAYYIKSEDDGLTWSESIEITSTFDEFKDEYNWTVIATGPGHGIKLENGRLLVPVWLSLNKSHAPSVVSTIYSDDNGVTWHRGDIIPAESYMPNPNETTAVELNTGDVMLNMRNTSSTKKRALTISENGNDNWTTPEHNEELDDAICFGSMARFTSDDEYYNNRILFSNINNTSGRSNLTIKMSMDEGKTWPITRTIYTGGAAYSDLAVSNDKNKIYCLYEKDGYNKLTLAKFNLEWLTKGEQSLDPLNEIPKEIYSITSDITLDDEWTSLDYWNINGNGSVSLNEEGNLKMFSNTNSNTSLTNTNVNITEDYTIEFKVKFKDFVAGSLGNNVTLGTKVCDGKYRLMLDFKPNGIYAITSNDAWTKIKDINIDNNWHDWKVVVDSGNGKLYMDNEFLCDFTLGTRNSNDFFEHWINGLSNDTAEIEEEYIKIYNNKNDIENLSLINTSTMIASATSEELDKENNSAKSVLDSNKNSMWHTKWDEANTLPHSITINLGREYELNKIGFLPRQEGSSNGIITEYELALSNDGVNFNKISEGTWTYGNNYSDRSEKIVTFDNTKASYVKLIAKKGVGGFASLAEMYFYRDEVSIISSDNLNVDTILGRAPLLPKKVLANLSNGENLYVPVKWNDYDITKCKEVGNFTIEGFVNGSDIKANCIVNVKANAMELNEEIIIKTTIGKAPNMPDKANIKYNDNTLKEHNVLWEDIDSSLYNKEGEFQVKGRVENTNLTINSKVIVEKNNELTLLINEAKTLNNIAIEGFEVDQYHKGAKVNLNNSILAAEEVNNNLNSTEEEYLKAIESLKVAIANFNSLIILENTGDINNNGKFDIGDLSIISKHYGYNNKDINWNEINYLDLNKDNIIDKYEIEFLNFKILK
ncbi:exo-alpha-sialidase [Clostridium tarantellae]|uniref:exo-alpha-sialidase n=1 Tax=Clostridium tarantellae TaxID=39493 RepID=A0A6I1MN43_9CLOT|nr:exo-alpha-sialidase [Clostridium tarantellae]MPQ44444.1 hypothetical protein [Clostridium tarantellae]